jgi:hypothetical protein
MTTELSGMTGKPRPFSRSRIWVPTACLVCLTLHSLCGGWALAKSSVHKQSSGQVAQARKALRQRPRRIGVSKEIALSPQRPRRIPREGPSDAMTEPPATASSTPTQTSHCFASPHLCGYPDQTNTGASGALTPSGSITVSSNGAVVKDKEVSGTITINADNVTIENVKIVPTATGSGSAAIANSGSGNVIKDVTAGGKGTGASTIEAAVRGFEGVTLERDYFYNCNECMQGGGTVRDSYMVVSSIYSGAHAEDIYICSDQINVNHSTLVNSVNQTATVFGDTICGGGNKFTVTNSLLAGSGYVFYPQANNTNPPGAQTTITANHIARCTGSTETKEGGHWYCKGGSDANGIYPFGGSYGIGSYFSGPTTWSGNVWDDNLATISEP